MSTGLKIIFAGTPEFAAVPLQALLKSSHQVIAVYTQPDRPAGRGQRLRKSPVKEIALQENIPVYQPASINKDECLRIKQMQADVMLVIAYGLLLPTEVLESPKLGCINVHASLLPKWRGAAPIQRAIAAGDTHTGLTIMQMVDELDAGPILHQIKCEIKTDDTGVTLHDRLANIASQEIADILQRLQNQEFSPIEQNDSFASYANKISKQEANINWNESALEIERKIRAFNSWPIAYTFLDGMLVRIWEAEISKSQSQHAPGFVFSASDEGIEVASGNGTLAIKTLQLAGGKVISAEDFNNAHNVVNHQFDCNNKAMVS